MALRAALLAPQSTYFLEKELQRRFNVIHDDTDGKECLLIGIPRGGGGLSYVVVSTEQNSFP